LDDLIAYVVGHFAHEEKEMQAKNYAGLAVHKAEHEKLIGVCGACKQSFMQVRLKSPKKWVKWLKAG